MSVLRQRKHAVKYTRFLGTGAEPLQRHTLTFRSKKLAWAMPSDDESCINFLRSIKFTMKSLILAQDER